MLTRSRTLSRLAPLVLCLLVAAMVVISAMLIWSASDRILPEVGSAVERVSGY